MIASRCREDGTFRKCPTSHGMVRKRTAAMIEDTPSRASKVAPIIARASSTAPAPSFSETPRVSAMPRPRSKTPKMPISASARVKSPQRSTPRAATRNGVMTRASNKGSPRPSPFQRIPETSLRPPARSAEVEICASAIGRSFSRLRAGIYRKGAAAWPRAFTFNARRGATIPQPACAAEWKDPPAWKGATHRTHPKPRGTRKKFRSARSPAKGR